MNTRNNTHTHTHTHAPIPAHASDSHILIHLYTYTHTYTRRWEHAIEFFEQCHFALKMRSSQREKKEAGFR
jgi:hypothetical protein